MYVVNQPKKSILSVIIIDRESLDKPLEKEIHSGIDEVSEMSDVVFIFPSGSETKVDCEKFTNLYSGCAWIVGDWEDALLEVLEYSYEIFSKHVGYILLDLSSVPEYPIDTVINITLSDSRSVIFKIERKTPEQLFDYYKVIREIPEKKLWEIWKQPKKNTTTNNFYTLWGTDSKFIYLRPQHITQYLEKRKLVDTFDSYRDFFASITKNLEIQHLDRNIEEVVYETKRTK